MEKIKIEEFEENEWRITPKSEKEDVKFKQENLSVKKIYSFSKNYIELEKDYRARQGKLLKI